MTNKLTYKIGDWVQSGTVVEFIYKSDEIEKEGFGFTSQVNWKRVLNRVERKVYGQIVGGAYRQTGDYCPQSGYSSEDGPDPAYFSIDKTIFVYIVREGFLNKPLECLPEDLQPAEPLKRLPKLKSRQPPADERYRGACRDGTAQQPRKNGRFSKSV